MDIKYQLFLKDHLLIQKFFGIFSLGDYLRYNRYIIKNISSNPIKKVLIDFRDLTFWNNSEEIPDDFEEELNKIIEARRKINQSEPKNKDVILVIWVKNPLPTVIADLFIKNFSNMNYNYCSTDSKAIEILKIPDYTDNLEHITENLENSFEGI
jgi:hypothetical protein